MEEGNGLSQLLCSWRGISLEAASQRCALRSNSWPQAFFRCCFHTHTVCPQVVFLPSLQKQHSALQALSQPSLLAGFKPHLLLEVKNSAPLVFQANGFGEEFFLCLPGVLLSCLLRPWLAPLRSTQDLCFPSTASPYFLPSLMWPLIQLWSWSFVLPIFRSVFGIFRMI